MLRYPDKPTTPEQWKVIAWGLIGLCVVLGSIGFWYSFRAPAGKAQLIQEIRWYSLVFWAVAAAVYGVKRLMERFFE